MSVTPMSMVSMYDALAEPAPAASPVGETTITKMKETVDNDVETVEPTSLSSLVPESDRMLRVMLAEQALAVSPRGETMGSKSKETVDQDTEASDPLELQRVGVPG